MSDAPATKSDIQDVKDSLQALTAWTLSHDQRHTLELKEAIKAEIILERRLTVLESAVNWRTALGAAVAGILSFFWIAPDKIPRPWG